jgi:hypothetical protein
LEPTFGEVDDSGGSSLAGAAPWLAVTALVLAAAAVGFVVFGRVFGGDLTACRTAAWAAAHNVKNLPTDWTLTSTDLNASGMTISILGPIPPDGSTKPPAVFASVTCYGDAAAAALEENRSAAEDAGSTVTSRTAAGDAYDIDNPVTGSRTTLFRVGGLVAQIAGGNSATEPDLAAITRAVAAAMGDRTAAGTSAAGPPDEANGSEEPIDSGGESLEPTPSSVASELELKMPTSIGGNPLTVGSSAADNFFADPTSRAFIAEVRTLGIDPAKLQVAQAGDDSQTVDLVAYGLRLPGGDIAKLVPAIERTWLSSTTAGVKQSNVSLGGKTFTKIDYGDGGAAYVYRGADYVIVIETTDPSAAAEAAAEIK